MMLERLTGREANELPSLSSVTSYHGDELAPSSLTAMMAAKRVRGSGMDRFSINCSAFLMIARSVHLLLIPCEPRNRKTCNDS